MYSTFGDGRCVNRAISPHLPSMSSSSLAVAILLIAGILLEIQLVPAVSTSRFRIQELSVVQKNQDCCKTLAANQSCSPCEVQLTFCAGIRFRMKSHYKDCHYLHFLTPLLSTDKFPYNTTVPITIRWPLTAWQLTVSVHDRHNYLLLETSQLFRNISSLSPATHMTIEAENITVQFSFAIECQDHFYGPTCTVYCNENLNKQNGDSFKCSSDGKKLCKKGWNGTLCDEPQCLQNCVHGTCVEPNICRCDLGWRGDSCSECVPLAGCQHGQCRRPNECECLPNWGGRFCDIDFEPCARHGVFCENGGTCVTNLTHTHVCSCTDGFTGKYCQLRLGVLHETEHVCSMLNCKAGICILTPTPRCELSNAGADDLKSITLVLSVVALCLAVITVIMKFICQKLEVIRKAVAQNPLNYSTHGLTTETLYRSGIRRFYSESAPEDYEKGLRSLSPPPTYDSGKSTPSSSSGWGKHIVGEITV